MLSLGLNPAKHTLVSDRLKEGQIRGIYHDIDKREVSLKKLCESLGNPKGKKHKKEKLEKKIENILKGQTVHEGTLLLGTKRECSGSI